MTVGRKPLPSNLHYLNGNPGKRKENLDQPKIEVAAPPCPGWLPKSARAEWRYIVKELKRYGIISKLDKATLATYCSSYALFQMATIKLEEIEDGESYIGSTPNGMDTQSVWFQIRNKAFDQIKSSAPELGLTPSARSRVKINNPDQGDMFDQF